MKFIKRLIVMSGENNRGTLSLEKNALGVFAKFNSFGRAISGGQLTVLTDGKKHYHRLNGDKASFELKEDGELSLVHAAVFSGGDLIMYGTNEPKRLSCLQIDALQQKKPLAEDIELGEKIFTSRKRAADYFLDIEGGIKGTNTSKNEAYCDDAIAEVNYYAKDFSNKEAEDIGLKEAAFTTPEPPTNNYKDISPAILEINYLLSDRFAFRAFDMEAERASNLSDFGDKWGVSQSAGQVAQTNMYQAGQSGQSNMYQSGQSAGQSGTIQSGQSNMYQSGQSAGQSGITPNKKRYYALKKIKKQNLHTPQESSHAQKGLKPHEQTPKDSMAAKRAAEGFNKTIERAAEIDRGGYVKARGSTFYERHGEDIEKIFKGEREKSLEKLLPNSKWARIDFSAGGKYYVIGLIGKEYLCYGVPADFTPQPPDELKGYCWWLPLDAKNPQGKGYWIMYQNLTTGEAVFP